MKDDGFDLIDKLLRVQDVIDDLVRMKRASRFDGPQKEALQTAIDDLQSGKESLDDFRDLLG